MAVTVSVTLDGEGNPVTTSNPLPVTLEGGGGGPLPVSGTVDIGGGTVAISTGGSTLAVTGTVAINGGTVNIASGDTVAVAGTVTPLDGLTFTGTATASGVVTYSSPGPSNGIIDTDGYSAVSVQVTAWGSGNTMYFEVSNDGVNWSLATGIATNGGGQTSASGGVGSYVISKQGRYYRNYVTSFGTGPVIVSVAMLSAGMFALPNALFVLGTATVGGTVSVANFPSTQPVSGTVALSGGTVSITAADTVSVAGTVAISGVPNVVVNSGTVSIGNSPTVAVAGTVPVSGSFYQVTQPVSGTVAVSSLPNVTVNSGTINVGNFPATQPVSGTVTIGNSPTVTVSTLPAFPAGTNTIGTVVDSGYAGTAGDNSITTGGTAQNLFGGTTPSNGFGVYNPDPSNDLWVSDSTTAAANGQGSIRVAANGGAYETPTLYKPVGAVSVFGAVTSQKITARRW